MATPAVTDSPLDQLTRMLWQQRRLLERLHYHLRVQSLLIASGEDDMLRHAVSDVQQTVDAIGELEYARTELVSGIGVSMGLDAEPSLTDLINRVPEPFEQILAEHRDAFLSLVTEITSESLGGRDQLERGLKLTRDMTAFILGDAGDGGYDSTGAAVAGSIERRLIDRSL